MAGNFYNINEAAEKLGKTEDEVRELVKRGKLREFRDGANLLFKIDEVEKLKEETIGLDITAASEVAKANGLEGSEIELKLDETDEISLLDDDTTTPSDNAAADLDLTSLGDLTSADTSVESSGLRVLDGTEDGFKLSEDTKGETIAEETADDILGDLDDDMNLEGVGSGSGLLDLSLQADDTSLGAVLDDILPTAAEGEAAADDMALVAEADDVFTQPADQEAQEAAPVSPVAAQVPGSVPSGRPIPMAYEPEPTGVDNALGVSLFIPLLAIFFTAIVVVGAFSNIIPGIVTTMQGEMMGMPMIWVVAIGLLVLILLMMLIGMAMGGKKKSKKSEVFQPQG